MESAYGSNRCAIMRITENRHGRIDIGPAYRSAREELAKIKDIENSCLKSGSECLTKDSEKEIVVDFLNRSYQITIPGIEILLTDSREEVSIKDKVLILHYLLSAKGTPLADRLISFRELPGGANYFPVFSARTIRPLVKHFGDKPQRLVDAAGKSGGHRVDYGDTGIVINAFNRVPVTITLSHGDEEFPADGNILFDASISDYLSTYDVTVLCERIVWKLIKLSREGPALG